MSDAATRARELLESPLVEVDFDHPRDSIIKLCRESRLAMSSLAELADEVERLQAKVAAFADIEEAHNASYRMLRDQSGMTELVAVQFSLTHLVDVGYDSWKETDHC